MIYKIFRTCWLHMHKMWRKYATISMQYMLPLCWDLWTQQTFSHSPEAGYQKQKHTHGRSIRYLWVWPLLCLWVMMTCQNFSSIFKPWNMVRPLHPNPSAEAGTSVCSSERPPCLIFSPTSCLTNSGVNFTSMSDFTWRSSKETPPPITCG